MDDIAGEFAVVAADFASRIAAARSGLSSADAEALIRRLRDEMTAALRAVSERLQVAQRSRSASSNSAIYDRSKPA